MRYGSENKRGKTIQVIEGLLVIVSVPVLSYAEKNSFLKAFFTGVVFCVGFSMILEGINYLWKQRRAGSPGQVNNDIKPIN